MVRHMILRRAVAADTGHPEDGMFRIVTVHGPWSVSNPGVVAVQASCGRRAGEVGCSVFIGPGRVAPAVFLGKVTNGRLAKLVAVPDQITLPVISASHGKRQGELHRLSMLPSRIGHRDQDGPFPIGLRFKGESVDTCLKRIPRRIERSQDRFWSGRSRGQSVSRLEESKDLFGVAVRAGFRPDDPES